MLTSGLAALVRMAAAQGARDGSALDAALRGVDRVVEAGELEAESVEEALLQSYLFLGFPAALDALARWRRISGRPARPAREVDPALWEARGPEVCRKVYGDQVDALRANIATLHPDLSVWMVMEGYGKVLGREGLGLRDRELLVSVLLAVQDAPTQLHSHLRGALRNGVTPAEVEAMLTEVDPWIPGPAARDRVRQTWARVRRAWQHRTGSGAEWKGGSVPETGAEDRGRGQGTDTRDTATHDTATHDTATSADDEAGHVH